MKYIGNKREKNVDSKTSQNMNDEDDLIEKCSKLMTVNSKDKFDKSNLNLISDNKKDKRRYKVLDQLNFYFSDENIVHDKYFRSLIQSNTEQAVKIDTLLSFNKIQYLLKDINDDYRYYYLFISVKNYSNFLCLSSNSKSIKRKEEFNFSKFKEIQNEIDKKTIYIDSKQKLSNKKIDELFDQNIAYISKNKCFVTFKDSVKCEEIVGQFAKNENDSENQNLIIDKSNKKKSKPNTKSKSTSISVFYKLDWLQQVNKKLEEKKNDNNKMKLETYKYSIIVDKEKKYIVKDLIFNSLNKKKIKEIRFSKIDENTTEVIALFNNLEEKNNSINYFSDKEYKLILN